MVKNILVALLLVILVGCGTMSTTTEKDIIEKADISTVSGYTDSIKKTVQVVSLDMTKVLSLYPSLQEKNVGLGFAESVLDYLDETNNLKDEIQAVFMEINDFKDSLDKIDL